MEKKSFWPERLREALEGYNLKGQLETYGDIGDIKCLKEEDIPLMLQVWDCMDEVYEGPKGRPGIEFSKLTLEEFNAKYPIFENSWEYFALRKPLKVGEVDPLPHISTLICNLEPFQSFRLKFPALYKTMIVWVWG